MVAFTNSVKSETCDDSVGVEEDELRVVFGKRRNQLPSATRLPHVELDACQIFARSFALCHD